MSRSIIFDRLNYIASDDFGVDPLSNLLNPAIMRLPTVYRRRCKDDEAGNPTLISFREYPQATVDLWWLILEYNGIVHSKHLVAGMRLRFPQYDAIHQLMQRVSRLRVVRGTYSLSSAGQINMNTSRTLKL